MKLESFKSLNTEIICLHWLESNKLKNWPSDFYEDSSILKYSQGGTNPLRMNKNLPVLSTFWAALRKLPWVFMDNRPRKPIKTKKINHMFFQKVAFGQSEMKLISLIATLPVLCCSLVTGKVLMTHHCFGYSEQCWVSPSDISPTFPLHH